jgi:hypothetical protein
MAVRVFLAEELRVPERPQAVVTEEVSGSRPRPTAGARGPWDDSGELGGQGVTL